MRIIAGTLGGRKLKTVACEGFRPAMGKTREALFSMLAARGVDWQSVRVLDLFAGSGSLAFEALSRGAPYALLVENAHAAVKCLQENIQALGLESRTRVVDKDVQAFLRQPPGLPFDLVFIDPPYGKNLTKSALCTLVKNNWLSLQAFVSAEVEKNAAFTPPPLLTLQTDRLFGQTRVCIWTV